MYDAIHAAMQSSELVKRMRMAVDIIESDLDVLDIQHEIRVADSCAEELTRRQQTRTLTRSRAPERIKLRLSLRK